MRCGRCGGGVELLGSGQTTEWCPDCGAMEPAGRLVLELDFDLDDEPGFDTSEDEEDV